MLTNEEFMLKMIRKQLEACITYEVNWNDVFELLVKHKLLIYYYPYIKQYLPSMYIPMFEKKIQELIDYQKALWEAFVSILEEAKRKHIKICLPKGFSLSLELYNDVFDRPCGDIDLLVDRSETKPLCQILRRQGFFHRRDAKIESVIKSFHLGLYYNFYEIKFIKYIRGHLIWAEVKEGSDAVDKDDISEFLDSAIRCSYNDISFYRLDDEHMFVHLCSNAYKDTMEYEGILSDVFRLRNFLDIKLFLKKKYKTINWGKVWNIGKRIGREYTIEWAIKCVEELFAIQIERAIPSLDGKNEAYPSFISFVGEQPFSSWILDNISAKERYTNHLWELQNIEPSLFSVPCQILMDSYQIYFSSSPKQIHVSCDYPRSGDRIYICLIQRFNKQERAGIETPYNNSVTVRVFCSKGKTIVQKRQFNVWKVNDQYQNNEEIEETNSVGWYEASKKIMIDLPIEYFDQTKPIFINIWIDGKVCDSYYRHKQYLSLPGETLKICYYSPESFLA